ncbi:unnamed protein product [Lathyrus oleraceus]
MIRVSLTFLIFISLNQSCLFDLRRSSCSHELAPTVYWGDKTCCGSCLKTGRKCVLVSIEKNIVASLDFRLGEIFWRHVLGTNDVVDGIGIALGRYVITLSSGGSILKAWNLLDRQMILESLPFRDQRNQSRY